MKTRMLLPIIMLVAGSLVAADSSPKDDVSAASKKLGQTSYSWKTTSAFGNFNNTSDGKCDKDGLVCLSMTFNENTTTAFLKNGKGAVKRQDEAWQSLADLVAAQEGQGGGRGRFLGRMLQNYKAPAVESAELVGKTKEIKKEGEVYSGDLTEEGAKSLLVFGGRRAPNAPEPRNAKGSVKFWVKDGALAKYELKLQGTMTINNEDRDIDRTTTIEVKDVGTTTVDVPEDAKKILAK